MTLGETPWVDRSVKAVWPQLNRAVPESWLPRWRMQEDSGRRKKLKLEEYGCGHYGCVMPTSEDGLVLKLTSDTTEARFVSAYLALPRPSGGLVEYRKILAIPGERRGRPLFLIWRSEAHHVGLLARWGWKHAEDVKEFFDTYQIHNLDQGDMLLGKFLQLAHIARDKITKLHKRNPDKRDEVLAEVWKAFENADPESDPRHYRGLQRIGITLRQAYAVAMEMANTDVIYPVGAALMEYMDEGLLLADTHVGNIGLDEIDRLVITDPGHAVAIHPKWTQWPQIEVLGG